VWRTHLILDATSKHSFSIRQLKSLYFHGYDFASTNIFVAKSNGVTFKCFPAAKISLVSQVVTTSIFYRYDSLIAKELYRILNS
jgi:hypothetical protein